MLEEANFGSITLAKVGSGISFRNGELIGLMVGAPHQKYPKDLLESTFIVKLEFVSIELEAIIDVSFMEAIAMAYHRGNLSD